MKLADKFKGALDGFARGNELDRLAKENAELREKDRTITAYVRRKVNQLLLVMGTLPLRPEELDDHTLLELDPIGIVADSFSQVLSHLNATNERLKLANNEIQAILSSAGVGILVVDEKMRVQLFNQKLKELFFCDDDDVVGKPCHEVLCHRHTPPVECTFEKILACRVASRLANWQYQDRHFDVAGAPIKNRLGDITHVVLAYHDITEFRRTEMVLRQNAELYRTMIDNVSELFQSVNPDGTFNFVNRAWRETLGYGEGEIAGLHLLAVIHPDHREECREMFRHLVAGKRIGSFATVFVAKDGTPVPVEGNLNIGFIDGKPTATSCIFRRAVTPGGPPEGQ